eukprot:3193366-Rhodomonas_salina.4
MTLRVGGSSEPDPDTRSATLRPSFLPRTYSRYSTSPFSLLSASLTNHSTWTPHTRPCLSTAHVTPPYALSVPRVTFSQHPTPTRYRSTTTLYPGTGHGIAGA